MVCESCRATDRKNNTDATIKECIEDTGINRSTVYRWWNKSQ